MAREDLTEKVTLSKDLMGMQKLAMWRSGGRGFQTDGVTRTLALMWENS